MHTEKTIPQMCRSTGDTDWCFQPSMDSDGPWLRANGHTIRYMTIDYTQYSQPTNHTVTHLQHWPDKGVDSSEHPLAKLGLLSLSTLTRRKDWRCKPAQQEMSEMYAAGWEHLTSIVTVWMNIWGVTQPGTGTWSPEDQWSVSFYAGAPDKMCDWEK